MVWVSPITWVTGVNSDKTVATLLNEEVSDHMNETAPAKVTTKGDLVVATGANAIARLAVGADTAHLQADSAETTGVKWTTTVPSHTH